MFSWEASPGIHNDGEIMGLFNFLRRAPKANEVALPEMEETYVAGVTFHQEDLIKAGVGSFTFWLAPEPDNEYDPKAVRVMAVTAPDEGEHIGYLAADLPVRKRIFDLWGKVGQPNMIVFTVSGEIFQNGDGSLYANVNVPTLAGFKEFAENKYGVKLR